MSMSYDWVCSECGATNSAGSEPCQKCGCPAVSSAVDIRRRKYVTVAPKSESSGGLALSGPKSVVAGVLLVVMIAGVVLERFTAPTMTLWWVALAMAVGAGLPLFAMLKSPKTRTPGNVAQPINPQDAAR